MVSALNYVVDLLIINLILRQGRVKSVFHIMAGVTWLCVFVCL